MLYEVSYESRVIRLSIKLPEKFEHAKAAWHLGTAVLRNELYVSIPAINVGIPCKSLCMVNEKQQLIKPSSSGPGVGRVLWSFFPVGEAGPMLTTELAVIVGLVGG